MNMNTEEIDAIITERESEIRTWCDRQGFGGDLAFHVAMALLHSEVGEASDAWRRWGLEDATATTDGNGLILYESAGEPEIRDGIAKPEGVGSEFADVYVRMLDTSGRYGLELVSNLRSYVTGTAGDVSDDFLVNMDRLHVLIAWVSVAYDTAGDYMLKFAGVLVFLWQLCAAYGIDLDREYDRKMRYNWTRPYKNGGKRA
jgi:hypothetical protein